MPSFNPTDSFISSIPAAAIWGVAGAAAGAAVGALGTYAIAPVALAGMTLKTGAAFCAMQPVLCKISDIAIWNFRRDDGNTAVALFNLSVGIAGSALITTKVIGYSLTLGSAIAVEAATVALYALCVLGALELRYQGDDSYVTRALFALGIIGILDLRSQSDENYPSRSEFYKAHYKSMASRLMAPFQNEEGIF